MKQIGKQRIYLDGALGSALLGRGVTCDSAAANIKAPEVVADIHNSYLRAGSDVIFTNTFVCNSLIQPNPSELKSTIIAAVNIAQRCAAPYKAAVGYSCGPLTELMKPFGKLSFDEAYSLFKEQADIIKDLNLDFVVLETFTDLLMLKCAYLAFSENTNYSVWCAMSFDENGRTFNGTSIGCFALTAQALGAPVIGINCSLGAKQMLNNAKELLKYAYVPVYVKPNAGLPKIEDGKTMYDTNALEFAEHMQKIAKLGVGILGGCCGTDDDYIRQTIIRTKDLPVVDFNNRGQFLCSASEIVELKSTAVIGERINPTGKPSLKQALIDKNFDYVLDMAWDQRDKGAHILDVNVGMNGVDENALLPELVYYLQNTVRCPLSVDSTRISAVERAIRLIAGVPLINSVNGAKQSMDEVLPVAAKYGAYIVALCLDEKGIPQTVEGRINIAERIAKEAEKYGIDKGRLLFDALTMSVAVDKNNALTTLETMTKLNNYGYKTVLGLSNVSFGLPRRELVNGTFYKMASENGLTAAIVNPSLNKIEDKKALAVLIGADDKCENYISAYVNTITEKPLSAVPTVAECVAKGLKTKVVELLKESATLQNFSDIIETDIIGGLNDLGKSYENGTAFLPQLIAGAECAKAALSYLSDNFMKVTDNKCIATVVLATVKGDIHDIGKNIVKSVLESYGYRIIDLGRDVPTQSVLKAVADNAPQVVGLSALMTTTLDNMAKTVLEIKQKYPDILIMVGGAVVSADFAKSVGAIYSHDAQETAHQLNLIFKEKK